METLDLFIMDNISQCVALNELNILMLTTKKWYNFIRFNQSIWFDQLNLMIPNYSHFINLNVNLAYDKLKHYLSAKKLNKFNMISLNNNDFFIKKSLYRSTEDNETHQHYVCLLKSNPPKLVIYKIVENENFDFIEIETSPSSNFFPKVSLAHSICILNGNIYLIGGLFLSQHPTFINDFYCLTNINSQNSSDRVWIKLNFDNLPMKRWASTMVSYKHTNCLEYGILFGGSKDWETFNDIWIFDGINFTNFTSTNPPPPRAAHSAVIINEYMHIISGNDNNGLLFNDHWKINLSKLIDDNLCEWICLSQNMLNDGGPNMSLGQNVTKVGDEIFFFGGRERNKFIHGLYSFNSKNNRWKTHDLNDEDNKLTYRTGHCAITTKTGILYLGGILENDILQFDMLFLNLFDFSVR